MARKKAYYTMEDYEKGLCDINGKPLSEDLKNDASKETESPKQEKDSKSKKKAKVSKENNDS